MARKSPVEMLANVGLFEGLTRKELTQIERSSRRVEFPAGRVIVREGESAVGFHLILDGRAKVSLRGRKRTVLGPGKFFGELALIDQGPRTATVTAETPVKTLSIASWEFLPLLDENHSIAKKILLEMCRRLRDADRRHTN